MELTRIEIKNFRSIKDVQILFDHNCLILLGKNEAGKSNILKAVAAIFKEYKVKDTDKRKRIENEVIKDNEYCIDAIIKLDEKDFSEIEYMFFSKYANAECIVFKNGKTIFEYIKTIFHEIILSLKITDGGSVSFQYWEPDVRIKNEFTSVNDIFIDGVVFNADGSGKKVYLESLILELAEKMYEENPYKCHYWEYQSSYLLPNTINIDEFVADPSGCKSLENIFVLCKRENIKKEFEDAMKQDGDYGNLLDQVSKSLTKTFRKIWKDFNETSIELRPNGEEIMIKVVNKAKYSFEDRSDGFKKFISILLMLSTQARSDKIGERDIILIDEPDQSLYPTSAQHLRDELLFRISEKAKIIYSTHSQYMIDSNCIGRHLIVEKNDDITTINKQNTYAPYHGDELLRRAIGSSIFECIKDKNIIFEGWLDKELFNKYCTFIKKKFENVGIVHLSGISGVENLVQILILANKKFVIVADSDDASSRKSKDFAKDYKEYADSWLAYSDVVTGISTMEDFITTGHIENHLKVESSGFVYDNSKTAIQNIEKVYKEKDKKQEFKEKIVEKLTKKDIKENYAEYVNKLKEKLDNL